MTWAPLLLGDPSPSLRLLVLRELLHREEDDPEVVELRDIREEDPLVSGLLELQQGDGSWSSTGLDASLALSEVHSTAQALIRLGYIGLGQDHPAVQRGAEFLFSRQRDRKSVV